MFKEFLYALLLREKTLDLTIVYTGLTTWGLQDGTESSTWYRRYRSWNVVYLSGLWSIWNRSQNSAGHSYHCKHHGKLSGVCHYSKGKGYEVRRQTHCMQLNNNNSFRSTKYIRSSLSWYCAFNKFKRRTGEGKKCQTWFRGKILPITQKSWIKSAVFDLQSSCEKPYHKVHAIYKICYDSTSLATP